MDNPDYHFDMDDQDMDNGGNHSEDERDIDPEMRKVIEQDLLFLIQGVGSIKDVKGHDVYVKHS